ncbi:hypothetical protein [Luteimonas terricola]|uniref:Uncharacterized protein n=1 Tax=Luteimonas terricola TaxID=645597 RepID=A0ABQ2EEY3_9GAMM|nr:hypothetical protein [Luteimonas terricola]GGK08847.1 hypothetical protein GCM10011394_17850 [Luteimonas terricola]
MTKNKIEDLRDHLFETIEALKCEEKPMDLARAKAISEVAQTIINSAKVEVDAMRVMDAASLGTDFIPTQRRSSLPLLPPRNRGDRS